MASTILIFLPLLLILVIMLVGYKRFASKKLAYTCLGLFALSIVLWMYSIATGTKDRFCEIIHTCSEENTVID